MIPPETHLQIGSLLFEGLDQIDLTGPFEVWKVLYTNDDYRLAFIGAYEAKNQMLVVVTVKDGLLLWNFMHSDARSMNKHRHGELLFRRYEIESKEKGQL